MSYRFPRWRMKDGEVIEFEDFNENCCELIGEVAGKLNDHNFKVNAFTTLTQLNDGAGARIYHGHTTDSGTTGFAAAALTANSIQLARVNAWQQLKKTVQDVSTPGGLLMIVGSLQHCGNDTGVLTAQYAPGCWYAIRVNGQVIVESVIGTSEITQDLVRCPDTDLTQQFSTPVPCWYKFPVAVQAVYPVSPGLHVIELVGMPYPNYDSLFNVRPVVENRELFVIELPAARS